MVDIKDNLFGTLAVRSHFVLPEQVSEALALQLKYELSGQPCPRLGEILAANGHMTPAQVQAVLQGQETKSGQKFGEMAIAWRFCQPEDIDAALAHQAEMRGMNQRPPRLGEILVIRGKMKPHQIKAVLQGQGKQIVQCPQCAARYNALNVTNGSRLTCPRCRNVFSPFNPAQDPLAQLDEEIRADQTVALPAIKDQEAAVALLQPKLEVGGYQLSTRLGTDRSGVLYKAFHPQTGNNVALRLLSLEVVQGAEQFDQWVSAGQTASELNHPHLQRILFMGSEGGRAFLVMEYIEGKSLRQRIQEQTRIPALEAIEIMIQIGEALAYGHARDLIHGDLRPNQILIGLDGRARLSGLGTPKQVLQDLKLMVGKAGAVPLYAAPEVLIDEDDSDERSDLYSLAAIGYHMITGRPPHSGSNFLQAGFRFASQEVLPPRAIDPNIAPYLSRLLLKGLSAEPDDRYASITSILADLRKCRGGLLIQAAEIPDLAPDAGKSTRRQIRPREKTERKVSKFRTHKVRSTHGSTHAASPRPPKPKGGASGVRHPSGRPGSKRRMPSTPSGARPSPQDTSSTQPVGTVTGTATVPIEIKPEPLDMGSIDDHAALSPSGSNQAVSAAEKDTGNEASPVRLTPPRPLVPAGLIPPRRTRKPVTTPVEKKSNTEFSPAMLAGIMVGLGVIVLVVVWAVSGRKEPPPETNNESRVMEVHKIEKAETTPALPAESAAAKEIRKDFQNSVEAYRKANPTQHAEILQRLDQFIAKYGNDEAAAEQIGQAKTQRNQHAAQGIASSLASFQEGVQNMASTGQFREAAAEANRWKLLWRDPAAETAAGEALKKVDEVEKLSLDEELLKAKKLRDAADWAGARALYETLIAKHRPDFATQARAEKLKTDQAEQDALVSGKLSEEKKKREQANAERETAAPARFAKLSSDLREALVKMDLNKAAGLLDSATTDLSGTSKGVELQLFKNDQKRLHSLLERMTQLGKESKLRDIKVPFQNEPFGIIDAVPAGPILDIKGGRSEVKWIDLTPEVLLEIAKRATHFTQGPEVFDLGVYYSYLDQPYEAEKVLRMAGKLGQAVDGHITRVLARQKDPGGKAEPAEKLPATTVTPATTPSTTPSTTPAPPAPNEPPAPGPTATTEQPAGESSLKALGWETSKGKWTITSEKILVGEKDANSQVATIKRELKRFKSVSVELRGECESAGFSFGLPATRFVIKPGKEWQKLTLEVDAGERLKMLLDGQAAKSADPVDPVTVKQLPDQIYLRAKEGKAEFRNYSVDGQVIGTP